MENEYDESDKDGNEYDEEEEEENVEEDEDDNEEDDGIEYEDNGIDDEGEEEEEGTNCVWDDPYESCNSSGNTSSKTSITQKTQQKMENDNKKNKDNVEISTVEFLKFLKTAYQVQDNIEKVLTHHGTVEWLKMKESELVKQREEAALLAASEALVAAAEAERKKSNESIKSTRTIVSTENENDTAIQEKLGEVLSEGILDPILPFMLPSASNCMIKKIIPKTNTEKAVQPFCSNTNIKKNSCDKLVPIKTDSQVEIHVCDELKDQKKDFICNTNLLLEKMGYFAEVTTGQNIQEMDISVHCDITIFEWLMNWVKKDSLLEEDWPELTPQCVIPILVSASFLQMDQLQQDCLLYCHENMNEILKYQGNLSCLNDSLLTQLAAMYTNQEVEMIKDRKDRIQSKIFMKMIMSLAEPEPESVRGHWCSLARLFRCQKCHQLVDPSIAAHIPCVASCMQLQCDGSIINLHIRDPMWNINTYISKLQKSLKSWRRVYWRLWSDCHFLYCTVCKRYFPVREIGWCRYHSEPPQYFTLDNQKAPLPVGRFSCCGERAFRFQLLPDYSGCKFQEHVVDTQNKPKESAIMQLLFMYRNLIEEDPPQLLFPERSTRLIARDPTAAGDKKLLSKEIFWWDGIQIIPPRPKLGLLSTFSSRVPAEEMSPNPVVQYPETTDEDTSDSSTSFKSDSINSDDCQGGESDTQTEQTVRKKKKKKRKRKPTGLWELNCSARNNQDNQRSYEENVMKEMIAVLNRRTTLSVMKDGGSSKLNGKGSRNYTSLGGIWVKLESDWKDANGPLLQNQRKDQRQKKLK